MSGGSLDYVSGRLDDAIESIRARRPSSLHVAFATHLADVSEALHALEWELSGDTGTGDADEAIRKVVAPAMEMEAARRALELQTGEALLVLKKFQPAESPKEQK